jgi:DNA-binding transcriptional ArsR family regulator
VTTSQNIFQIQAKLCQTMSNPARLQIVHVLRAGPQCVKEIAKSVELPQTAVSHHLSILRRGGVVTSHRAGQEVLYQIANPKIVHICDLMREVLIEGITRQTDLMRDWFDENAD